MTAATLTKKTLTITSVFGLIAGLTVAVFMPIAGFAWPWDDNRKVQVSGQVQCNGFDLANDFAFQKVEGFEIRGRSDVRRDPTGTGLAVSYSVSVPPGWEIEYSVKCSGNSDWLAGSFGVSKTLVGTSYKQSRNVCVDSAISFAPCVSQDYGYCIELWLGGAWRPSTATDQVFRGLYKSQHRTLKSVEGCARAVEDSLPKLSTQPAPTPEEPIAPIPQSTYATEQAQPSIAPAQEPSKSPSTQPQPQPQGTSQITAPAQVTVVIDNRVTNGGGMREDPTPSYLSTVAENRCRSNGCMVSGTDMRSGASLVVECQVDGARTTNGNDSDAADDSNPELFESTRWYRGVWPDGRTGYISEVWIRSDGRGGLGLRTC